MKKGGGGRIEEEVEEEEAHEDVYDFNSSVPQSTQYEPLGFAREPENDPDIRS